LATATETQRSPQSPNRLLRIGIKPLTKLRPKPQVSAAFRCSSIGIDAYRNDPADLVTQVEIMADSWLA
jgi:hypothetical protein